MVSVCLITYHHEQFIADALDNILSQETDFPFEIIIGEDCGTDGTRKICEHYRDLYPGIITLLPSDKNLGMMNNFIRTFQSCRGSYIAFTEGDDYWTDKNKLQKQFDFLENNPDFSTCFHNVKMVFTRNQSKGERPYHGSLEKNIFITEDLLCQWFIPTTSVMVRNYKDFELPDWFRHCKSGDIPFLLLMSLRGPLKYLNEIMGVYRVHDTGMSGTHNGYNKIIGMIFIYENFNIFTGFRFQQKINEAVIYEIHRHLPYELKKLEAEKQVATEPEAKMQERNISKQLSILQMIKRIKNHF
jgi:glycosyltransferase involved in cell wall biosynthesis